MDAIAWLTVVLILVTMFYARQNRRMVQEMRRQNRPYVYIVFDRRLVIRNGGDRSAHQVRFAILEDAHIAGAILKQDSFGAPTEFDRVPVSSVAIVRHGVHTLLPAAERVIGPAPFETQTLKYRVCYQDGAGIRYKEVLTEEFPG